MWEGRGGPERGVEVRAGREVREGRGAGDQGAKAAPEGAPWWWVTALRKLDVNFRVTFLVPPDTISQVDSSRCCASGVQVEK